MCAVNRELGAFLRARRDAADADAIALPSYGRRRAPGIRREELAVLAGVSTSYYVRIEQGTVTASAAVLDAIANALGFEDEDRRHMAQLAHTRDYGPAGRRRQPLGADLVQLLRHVDSVPVGVLGHDMTLLGWNQLCHAVFAPHLEFRGPAASPGFNWARQLFLDERSRALFAEWDAVTIDLTGRLRASFARHPDDADLAALIAELRASSDRFATLWQWHPVRERPLGTVRLHHPVVGPLQLHDTVLRPADSDDQLVIAFLPSPGPAAEQLRRLQRPEP